MPAERDADVHERPRFVLQAEHPARLHRGPQILRALIHREWPLDDQTGKAQGDPGLARRPRDERAR